MGQRELIHARADAERSKAGLMATLDELKYRLKPSTLASDAWNGVKEKSGGYAGRGKTAVTDHPAAAGGAIAAVALFLLRHPIAGLLTRAFGKGGDDGRVTTDLTDTKNDYDLTAPVVTEKQGVAA